MCLKSGGKATEHSVNNLFCSACILTDFRRPKAYYILFLKGAMERIALVMVLEGGLHRDSPEKTLGTAHLLPNSKCGLGQVSSH